MLPSKDHDNDKNMQQDTTISISFMSISSISRHGYPENVPFELSNHRVPKISLPNRSSLVNCV
jgi:hypothetical protein